MIIWTVNEQSNLHSEVTAIAPKSLTTFFFTLKAKSSDLVFEDIDDDLDQELGNLTLGKVELYSRTSMCDHLS